MNKIKNVLFLALVFAGNSFAEESTNCLDLLIGAGQLKIKSQGVNQGSLVRKGVATFNMVRSDYSGHANFKGYFSIGTTYNISSGEIAGNNFSFTTTRFKRDDGTAFLEGSGRCDEKSATGKMAYRGAGDGYTFNIYFTE